MSWIRTIAREMFGLFVDDGSFAVSILAWIAVVWLVLPRLGLTGGGSAIILFVGLALILVESAARGSRR